MACTVCLGFALACLASLGRVYTIISFLFHFFLYFYFQPSFSLALTCHDPTAVLAPGGWGVLSLEGASKSLCQGIRGALLVPRMSRDLTLRITDVGPPRVNRSFHLATQAS